MRAALYFRVSTDEQKERASIETQREFAAQYCKVHEITVIASYNDDGVSGTIPVAGYSLANCQGLTCPQQLSQDDMILGAWREAGANM